MSYIVPLRISLLTCSLPQSQLQGDIDSQCWNSFRLDFLFQAWVDDAHWAAVLVHRGELSWWTVVSVGAADTLGPTEWAQNSWVFRTDRRQDGTSPRRWKIWTRDVSRDCLLSRGGFWKIQVSSSEPKIKGQNQYLSVIQYKCDLSLNTWRPNIIFLLPASVHNNWYIKGSYIKKNCKALRCSRLRTTASLHVIHLDTTEHGDNSGFPLTANLKRGIQK